MLPLCAHANRNRTSSNRPAHRRARNSLPTSSKTTRRRLNPLHTKPRRHRHQPQVHHKPTNNHLPRPHPRPTILQPGKLRRRLRHLDKARTTRVPTRCRRRRPQTTRHTHRQRRRPPRLHRKTTPHLPLTRLRPRTNLLPPTARRRNRRPTPCKTPRRHQNQSVQKPIHPPRSNRRTPPPPLNPTPQHTEQTTRTHVHRRLRQSLQPRYHAQIPRRPHQGRRTLAQKTRTKPTSNHPQPTHPRRGQKEPTNPKNTTPPTPLPDHPQQITSAGENQTPATANHTNERTKP